MLSRLAAQRAPLALALPLLAAYAPECTTRSLHVFVRRPSADYAKVQVGDGADAGDLKQAVIAALKLGAPPDCVRLLHEAAGGGSAPCPWTAAGRWQRRRCARATGCSWRCWRCRLLQ